MEASRRATQPENGPLILCIDAGKLVVLPAFIKKTSKTPPQDIEV